MLIIDSTHDYALFPSRILLQPSNCYCSGGSACWVNPAVGSVRALGEAAGDEEHYFQTAPKFALVAESGAVIMSFRTENE